jgi:hypothetical protein
MPDITMCTDKSCIFKNNCLRFQALPNQCRQAYFLETPFDDEELECFNYIHIEGRDLEDLIKIKTNYNES